jgi:hypothetical protein
MAAGDSRFKPPLALVVLWHAKQFFFRTGYNSLAKSTGVSRLRSAIGKAAEAVATAEARLNKNNNFMV